MEITLKGEKPGDENVNPFFFLLIFSFCCSGVLPGTKPSVLPSGSCKCLGFNVLMRFFNSFSLADPDLSFNLKSLHSCFPVEVHTSIK